ncbi:MAG: DUF6531 domain-containing protein, partial [Chloroflexota bacterium]
MDFHVATVPELINAILAANTFGGVSRIILNGGKYTLTAINNTLDEATGLPTITGLVTIEGHGSTIERASTAPEFRIFQIGETGGLTLQDLTVTGGKLTEITEAVHGGGITIGKGGYLRLERCTISNNELVGAGYGGAILIELGSVADIIDSVISDNTAYNGGGIFNSGALTVDETVFARNHGLDAAALDHNTGTAYVTNCQFYENTAIVVRCRHAAVLAISTCDFYDNDGNSLFVEYSASGSVSLQHSRLWNNAWYIDNGSTTHISVDARYNWWGSNDGPSVAGSGSGDGVGTYVDYLPFVTREDCVHKVACNCNFNYASEDCFSSPNPISLRMGEKRLEATDLSLNTPAGALAFTRTYSQNQQTDAHYQFMGLGWTHNHAFALELAGSSPARTAQVYLPQGGVLALEEDSPDHFTANAGSYSELTHDISQHLYILTGQDKSVYQFDDTTQLLQSHIWPNSEVWTYTYSSGRLTEIDDGYGRKLKFSYIDNSSAFDDGQLWRVGDHTASGLGGGTPSGRYAEFAYVEERDDGMVVSDPKALLSEVRDVLGNSWTYSYYGQQSGETEDAQLNFLTARQSPLVDLTGDGVADETITLEQDSYTLDGDSHITEITQARGIVGEGTALLETVFSFSPPNYQETSEVIAGRETIHFFDRGVYAGSQDPAGNQTDTVVNSQFRPAHQVSPNGDRTSLAWSDDGKQLQSIADPLGNQTVFDYKADDTLNFSIDAQSRKTQYSYDDTQNPRLPTRVKVIDSDEFTVLRWQEFVYDAKGRTTAESVLDPADGTTALQMTTRTYYPASSGDPGYDANGAGLLQSLTQHDLHDAGNNASTTYTYDNAGRVVKTQQSSLFGSCQVSYTVYDDAGNVVATICNYENSGAVPTTAEEAAALYDAEHPDKNHVTCYTYDALNRRMSTTVNAGADFAQTTLTFYDALSRVVRTITNYVNQNAGDPEEPALWIWNSTSSRWEVSESDDTPIDHGADN